MWKKARLAIVGAGPAGQRYPCDGLQWIGYGEGHHVGNQPASVRFVASKNLGWIHCLHGPRSRDNRGQVFAATAFKEAANHLKDIDRTPQLTFPHHQHLPANSPRGK